MKSKFEIAFVTVPFLPSAETSFWNSKMTPPPSMHIALNKWVDETKAIRPKPRIKPIDMNEKISFNTLSIVLYFLIPQTIKPKAIPKNTPPIKANMLNWESESPPSAIKIKPRLPTMPETNLWVFSFGTLSFNASPSTNIDNPNVTNNGRAFVRPLKLAETRANAMHERIDAPRTTRPCQPVFWPNKA